MIFIPLFQIIISSIMCGFSVDIISFSILYEVSVVLNVPKIGKIHIKKRQLEVISSFNYQIPFILR